MFHVVGGSGLALRSSHQFIFIADKSYAHMAGGTAQPIQGTQWLHCRWRSQRHGKPFRTHSFQARKTLPTSSGLPSSPCAENRNLLSVSGTLPQARVSCFKRHPAWAVKISNYPNIFRFYICDKPFSHFPSIHSSSQPP